MALTWDGVQVGDLLLWASDQYLVQNKTPHNTGRLQGYYITYLHCKSNQTYTDFRESGISIESYVRILSRHGKERDCKEEAVLKKIKYLNDRFNSRKKVHTPC